jgi:hypothetical protein
MDLRTLTVSAALALSLAGLTEVARADIIAGENGVSVAQSDVATPSRGMTMSQVASKFGSPTTKVPAVGNPPISRWEYPGFVVYFERDHVIHAVVSSSGAPVSESTPAAPASAAPPASAPAPAAPATPASPAAPAADQSESPQP